MSQPANGPGQREQRRRDNGTVGTASEDVPDLLAGLRTGDWLDRQKFPPLAFAIPGLIPEGLTLLIGPPKAGKSWLLLNLMLAVASGGVALGAIEVPARHPVLYLALEDSDRRMQDRCRTLLGNRYRPDEPIPPAFCYLTAVAPGAALATIAAFLDRHPDTSLVAVDTLGKVMPPAMMGESAYQRDYRVGSALKRLADSRPGLAIIVAHHDRKAIADDFVDSVSGTHGLAGAADTITVLARRRHSAQGLLKITGRDVPEDEYALSIADGMVWQLDGTDLASAARRAAQLADAGSLGDTSGQIIEFARTQPGGIITNSDAAVKFGPDARRYLARLAQNGRLTRVGRGRYAVPSAQLSHSQVSGTEDWDTGDD